MTRALFNLILKGFVSLMNYGSMHQFSNSKFHLVNNQLKSRVFKHYTLKASAKRSSALQLRCLYEVLS